MVFGKTHLPGLAIDSPADCEVFAVIRFFWAKNILPAEIHRELCSVHGETMSDSAVRKWCRLFGEGRTNVHDEERSGRPSVVNDDFVEKINENVRENGKFTYTELSECFPQISRTVIYEIVSQKQGYHKYCARWVPKPLTDAHKMNGQGAVLTFFTRYNEEGDAIFDHIVTGDKTWVSYVNVEQKNQTREWSHTSSPCKPIKYGQIYSNKKITATVFLGQERGPFDGIHGKKHHD